METVRTVAYVPMTSIVLGIVGSHAAKFTHRGEQRARARIRNLIRANNACLVVSGRCPEGGIDIWAVEEAHKMGVLWKEYPPRANNWEDGFKPRNIQIAVASEKVVCITVRELPEGYRGRTFKLCYHCGTSDHVKSGGCWTMKYARSIGKLTELIIL